MTERTRASLGVDLSTGGSRDQVETRFIIDLLDSIFTRDDSDLVTVGLVAAGVTSSVSELNILDGVTATAAELNAAADVSGRLVTISDAATYTALAANSGKPHTIPDLTATCTITLPAVASGLEYEFIYRGIAADAQNWIIDTGADANYFLGGLVHLDTDANSAGDEVVPIAGDGNSNSKLTVVTPDVGTRVKMVCDGTNWILSGFVASATVPSFADQ